MKRLLILSSIISAMALGSSVAYAGSAGSGPKGGATVAVCETDPKSGNTYTLYVSQKGADGKVLEGIATIGACV